MAVTDLTGTKWYFNESFTTELATGSYFINFISNNTNFSGISADTYNSEQRLYYDNTLACSSEKREDYWKNEAFRTIEITGGTYVTHAPLIAWLQANATQIQDESNPISVGNLPIANMYFGTQQVKKVYLGNTLVWEKEETGYTVTLNCGGGSSYTKGSVYVYDSTYAGISSSNLIFSQDSLDLSAYPVTLTVESGHCTVCIDSSGRFIAGKYITSSDFTKTASEGYSGVGEAGEFLIDKNGTIEFGADDWDD